jgi:hypothetical protein
MDRLSDADCRDSEEGNADYDGSNVGGAGCEGVGVHGQSPLVSPGTVPGMPTSMQKTCQTQKRLKCGIFQKRF